MIKLMLCWALLTTTASGDWSGFRGDGSGTFEGSLPTRWSDDDGIAWRTTLDGFGQSAPIVWKDQAYVTCVEGAQQEQRLVHAVDLGTGKVRWTHRIEAGTTEKNDFSMARAASTPVADADGVYVFFSSGELLALTHDGQPRWQRSLVEDYGRIENRNGHGASLIQNGETVFVLMDDSGPSYLLAIEKKTGETRWKTERTSRRSWTSPIYLDRGADSEIVVSSSGTVDGYDPASGTLLWQLDDVSGNSIISATPVGRHVLVGAGQVRGGSPGSAAASNRLIDPRGKDDVAVLWKAEKALAHYASPMAHRGHAYFVNRVGVLYCLDLKTGEQKYAERIAGECWASPIAAGDFIYFFGKDGATSVIKAGPSFEVVATNELGGETTEPEPEPEPGERRRPNLDTTVHGVAAATNRILIRTGKELICVGG